MTTNLLIGTCDIPLAAVTMTPTNTAETYFGETNLFGLSLNEFYRLQTAVTGDTRIDFDLGVGFTKAANFLYLAKANMLQKGGVGSITLKGGASNSYAGATSVYSDGSFGSASLIGPNGEDYLATFGPSSPFEYWFQNYNATGTSKRDHAKLYFGTALDLGRDPVTGASYQKPRASDAQRKSRLQFTFNWKGVSYANTVTFINTVARYKDISPVVLFTTSYHKMLNDYHAVLCRVINPLTPVVVEAENEISATFLQMI